MSSSVVFNQSKNSWLGIQSEEMITIQWSRSNYPGFLTGYFPVFMNKLRHDNSTNQKEDTSECTVHRSWPVQGIAANRSIPFNLKQY
jgi:hypothetical protein